MNDPKNERPRTAPTQGTTGTSKKAEKVRSSRYEWENKSDGSENSSAAATASGASQTVSLGKWLKKLFSESLGLFDNDDDPTPSAA